MRCNLEPSREFKLEWGTKEQIHAAAALVSLHLPLTRLTKNMIRREQLLEMKKDSMIINTACDEVSQVAYDVQSRRL